MAPGTVAVIGLGMLFTCAGLLILHDANGLAAGPLGLVTLKNLLEKGFEVTGFDKTDVVGGLWNFRDDEQTTVLESRPCSRTRTI